MLRKFISIKNIGRFVKAAASGDVELKRYNLVFAENGRGKTTLCAILRSLQSGDPAHIRGRTTLGATAPPEAQIRLEGVTATFAGGVWSTTFPALAVFDSTFISENVYSGDVVGLGHRRNLYGVIVGNAGRLLAQQIEQLDGESRTKSTEIRERYSAVQALAQPGGFDVDAFIELAEDPEIDNKIAAAERELEAARQVDQIRTRPALSPLVLPVIPEGFRSLLDKTLDGVAQDAESRITQQIAAHSMHQAGQTWLVEGLGYVRNDACPFCGQGLRDLPLIAAYRAYFSEAYGALRGEIRDMRGRIDVALGDRAVGTVERTLDQNASGVEFWSRYAPISTPVLPGREGLGDTIRSVHQAATALLERKAAAPLDRLALDPTFEADLAALTAFHSAATSYAAAVAAANDLIETRKNAAGAATVRDAEMALARLRAAKTRHEPDGRRVCANYQAPVADKIVIELTKEQTRARLNAHTEGVIRRYEQSINRFLDDFGAGFQLTGTAHDYVGGPPRSTYQILINDTPVDLGDVGTPLDRPSFRNTLSSGDRSTLALAFFLAQLKQDPDKASKVVVLDDPFNSQDGFRKEWTAQKIEDCGEECAQVTVLSHDHWFLKNLWDRLPPADRKCLELKRVGPTNTTFCEWDIEKATQDRFQADLKTLTDYHTWNIGDPLHVIQKIRPVLETFCKRVDGGGALGEKDSLGEMVGKVRAAGAQHLLYSLCDDLETMNTYIRRYYHGEGNVTPERINDGELQTMVKRTLAITGGC